ncbi:inner nuclear membrane protein heh2-related [Anaeramoeba flamelloides]|uniref:Inner nuclear membrane protein heh2-related n=1 Tax=Anaeramoeba flamelloides TaxID=1746091 RepID=A0ABQ8Y9I4_9EUKA|nr:inner nuclear membrane protein heh2-related [Anaeramoeba flamelloides]
MPHIKKNNKGEEKSKKKQKKFPKERKKTKEEIQTNRKLNFEETTKKNSIMEKIFNTKNSSTEKKRSLDQLDEFSDLGSDSEESAISLNATPTADNLHILKQRRTISKNKNNQSVNKSHTKSSYNSADKTQNRGYVDNSNETTELAYNVREIKNRSEADIFPNINHVNWDPNDEIEEGSNHLVTVDNGDQNYSDPQGEQEIVYEEEDDDEDDDDDEEEELQQTYVSNRVFLHQASQNRNILDKVLNSQIDPCVYSVFIIVIFLLLCFFVLPILLNWLKQI